MIANVSTLHHFTVGCAPADLPVLLAFYTRTLGLTEGYRPDLRNPGYWLYAGGHALVHLNALLKETPARGGGGGLDHIALVAHGLVSTRASLQAEGIPFEESPLKGTHLHQVFVKDPLGLKLELNFDLDAEGLLAAPSSP
ncbi:VOC family protein [Variovorax sp. J22P168]|uniref:VOC family protein n=1 Tax=Variovorax jilinensis TaxID=3053513 RepID=UPI0025772F10|nr:VOC family protein [Variovorax sp. J22P168]MDM0015303.1 VOC family protein [Variovorax sp. J22P168]